MKTKKHFIVPLLALLACSCQDDIQDEMGGGTNQPATGEEVTFSATLGQDVVTRTIYGDYDEDNSEYPIYWVNGDEVIVTSPECANNGGVGSATYSVSVDGEEQNYASNLEKTGDAGVQWGTNETGTFYSVYPASKADFASNLTTVTLNMPQQQNCKIDDNGKVNPVMDACFMYAKTEDATSGNTVNLKYIPISTAIRFTLQGPSSGDADAVTITGINFSAPTSTSICGTFEADLSDIDTETNLPLMTVKNGYHAVTVSASSPSTSGYLTLGAGDTAEMNVFLLLTKETEVTSDWKITIQTATGTTYSKSLELKDGENTLVPGKVHNLPTLPNLNSEQWDVSNWMKNIPRNVYLSEISIPGSWNSMNSDFQNNTSIQAQYNAGARAFHIDTRWQGSYFFGFTVTGFGVADGGSTAGSIFNNTGLVMSGSNNPTFESVLNTITGCVQEDEYIVVYCTFAQNSYDYQGSGGWEKAISDVCDNNTAVIDAKTLDENSVVADVLGKVIVIINTDEVVTSLGLTDSKCLFMTDMDMTLTRSTYTNEDYTVTTLADGSGSTCVNALGTHAQVTAYGNSGYNTSSRGYAPTLLEREEKAGNILSWSQNNHQANDYAHNTWFYLGLGGYIVDSDGDEYDRNAHSTVASELNPWINTQIANMETSSYYPVGIVLMNFVTDYSTVMENILKLNNTYLKAYDENRSSVDGSSLDGSSTTTTSMKSAATGYSSGMKDNNTAAIGWD